MASLAVYDALVEACGLETDIKWPNDIYAGGRKLCGILAETVETQMGRACVLGIGINLNDDAFPPELQRIATSIEAHTHVKADAEKLLQALVRSLALRYEALYEEGGQGRMLAEWSARSSFAEGRRVRVSLEGETLEGTTRGLASDGALRVETDAGKIRVIRAGDVTTLRAQE
jgi:BirA family biotin operon repressor/biotin-[acetyl-CoA-carboxylase] ligase